MRWLAITVIALALLLVGWTAGQKIHEENVAKKVELLEKRLDEAERKIGELKREVADLRRQVAQMRLTQRLFVIPTPSFPFGWQIPEERHGFGLPRPAPVPFVQPYYYPLEKQP